MLVRQYRPVGCVAWDGLIGGSETGGMERREEGGGRTLW